VILNLNSSRNGALSNMPLNVAAGALVDAQHAIEQTTKSNENPI
jgi:hypothetical protein